MALREHLPKTTKLFRRQICRIPRWRPMRVIKLVDRSLRVPTQTIVQQSTHPCASLRQPQLRLSSSNISVAESTMFQLKSKSYTRSTICSSQALRWVVLLANAKVSLDTIQTPPTSSSFSSRTSRLITREHPERCNNKRSFRKSAAIRKDESVYHLLKKQY